MSSDQIFEAIKSDMTNVGNKAKKAELQEKFKAFEQEYLNATQGKSEAVKKQWLKSHSNVRFEWVEEDDEDDILNTMFGEAFDDDDFAETFDEAADEISDMLDELFFGAL